MTTSNLFETYREQSRNLLREARRADELASLSSTNPEWYRTRASNLRTQATHAYNLSLQYL